MDNTKHFVFVGYDKRFFAAIIDAVIGVSLSMMVIFMMKHYIGIIYPMFLVNLILVILYIILIIKYGGSPGKLLLGVRIVNKQGSFISLKSVLLRFSFIFLMSINSFLKYYHVFAIHSLSEQPQTFREISNAIKSYGGIYNTIGTFLFILFLIDVGIILLPNNKKNRAIHDFIAGSYVITKKSYFGQNR